MSVQQYSEKEINRYYGINFKFKNNLSSMASGLLMSNYFWLDSCVGKQI